MRFIANFFFFGILFYLIWMFFPDAFLTLVSWADHVVAFFRELIVNTWDKVQHTTPTTPEPAIPPPVKALLPWLALLRSGGK